MDNLTLEQKARAIMAVQKYVYIPLAFIVLAAHLAMTTALANCPLSCRCDEQNLVVNCGEGQLDVLPIALNPSITRLIIQNNRIRTIDSSVQFYSELTFLDLSYNHLLVIPARTFQYQKKLKELNLNHNKIGMIAIDTFIGLSTITSLNLGSNLLGDLVESVFSTLPKLEELNLSRNRISQIHPKAFNGLANLRVLYLNDNTLSRVPTQALSPLNVLAELYLGINVFESIESEAFANLNGLSLLDLKGAALNNLSADTFHGLESNLRKLDISDNRLQQIPTAALNRLTRLEVLALGQNGFETIPNGALTGLAHLRQLDCSGSLQLHTIEANAFETNTNLETLNIASNKALSHIETGAFSGLPFLKNINLRDNALAEIPENLFKWDELDTFDLSDNPIHCDCRMLWLQILLLAKNTSQTAGDNVLCASPITVHNQSLKTLAPDILGCATSESRRQALIGILLIVTGIIVILLLLLMFRWRRRIRELFKGRWGDAALASKEREYQKTFSDEEFVHSNLRHHHAPCTFSVHPPTSALDNYTHQYHQASIRPIPVTEL